MPRKEPDVARKLFGVRLDRALMVQLQHLALDQDRYVNELLEEAARDLLKKYKDKQR